MCAEIRSRYEKGESLNALGRVFDVASLTAARAVLIAGGSLPASPTLLPHETVHHKDGNRLNNDPENLELRVGNHGKGATASHCVTCTCFRKIN